VEIFIFDCLVVLQLADKEVLAAVLVRFEHKSNFNVEPF
jgi:hypothetical protein